MKKADLVLIGKVARSQGRDGCLKVRLYEKVPSGFSRSSVYLRGNRGFEGFEVESLVLDRNSHFLKLCGVDTLARADALAGLELYVEESLFPPLEKGRFYLFQLVGCRVVKRDGSEVGTVTRILPAGGSNLLVVAREAGEVYVPFTDAICVEVDREARAIVIDPPDGLLELNEI